MPVTRLVLLAFGVSLLFHTPAGDDGPTRRLNDFGEWERHAGEWKLDDDKRIAGAGDSVLVSKVPLPADGDYSFTMTVLSGMRPRVTFDGTDLMVGNEGFSRVIEAYGGAGTRGVKFAYDYDQPMRITVKFRGRNFELWIDNELMSRGKRKRVPETVVLRLSAGDGWSKGSAAFSDFEFTPVAKEQP